MTEVRARVWRDGRVVEDDFPLADLDIHLAAEGDLVWLDLCAPDPDDLARLSEELQLDPLAVEDAVTPGERPKASRHETHMFVTMYSTRLSDGPAGPASRLDINRISAFLMPRGLITVRRDEGFDVEAVVERWDENPDLLRHGPEALLYGLLDVVVDGYFDTIQRLDDAVEDIEDSLFDDRTQPRAVQQRVFGLRKELVELRRVVLPMREVVNGVMRHRAADATVPHPLDGYFADVYDHVLRASEWTESVRDMLTTIFETALSLQDARLNTVMKKLAAWAAIIAVPTAVTGWFGQNIPYPGFGTQFGLWQSVVLMVVGTVGLWLLFRKYDWI